MKECYLLSLPYTRVLVLHTAHNDDADNNTCRECVGKVPPPNRWVFLFCCVCFYCCEEGYKD